MVFTDRQLACCPPSRAHPLLQSNKFLFYDIPAVKMKYQFSLGKIIFSFADQIGLPDFNAGAMENWGLITYRETALLYDEKFSSNSNKERIATIIGHELAHMVRFQCHLAVSAL